MDWEDDFLVVVEVFVGMDFVLIIRGKYAILCIS